MSVALKRNKGHLEWSATGAPGVGMGIVPQSITADSAMYGLQHFIKNYVFQKLIAVQGPYLCQYVQN
jgi:hypothetical protein